MTIRLLPAALLLSVSAALTSQPQRSSSELALASSAFVTPSPWHAAPSPICDGSAMRRFERTQRIGRGVLGGALIVDLLWAASTVHSPRQVAAPVGAGLGLFLVAAYVDLHSYPNESFWQRTLEQAKVGETRSADVRACLHEPWASSSSIAEETLTYFTTHPNHPASSGRVRAVSFVFRDSVLRDVRRYEVHLRETPERQLALPGPVAVPDA